MLSWQEILALASPVAIDALQAYLKKSPSYLLAPYKRLWKETWFVRGILHKKPYAVWTPGRCIALRAAIKARGKLRIAAESVLELLESSVRSSEPIALLGEPGAGKTTALQALTYGLAKQALRFNLMLWGAMALGTAVAVFASICLFKDQGGWLGKLPWVIPSLWLASFMFIEPMVRRWPAPVFMEARTFEGTKVEHVKEWCEKNINEWLGDTPFIGSQRRVAIIIDGVNEVKAEHCPTFNEGWRRCLLNPQIRSVIFTSRSAEDPTQTLKLDNVITVCDLDDPGVIQFLKVYGREKAAQEGTRYDDGQAARERLELESKELLVEGGIGRNPYWLKMMVQSGVYTPNRGRLFRDFTRELIGRELEVTPPEARRRKRDWKRVPLNDEMDALASLALKMYEMGAIGLGGEAGKTIAEQAIQEAIGDGKPYSVLDVFGLAQDAMLLEADEERESVRFSHQLVQEFFTAYKLRRLMPALLASSGDSQVGSPVRRQGDPDAVAGILGL